ncbi:MAG: hypothetical protein ACYDBH_00340 [Acidobacteriaceae bacterium]
MRLPWWRARSQLPYILTYTGRRYVFSDPRVEDIHILDIAHHLSMLCRFTGAVSRFYSVAEHSVGVSYCVAPENALVALMHDATEAYVGDLSSPLKRLLPGYRRIERLSWMVIAKRFHLPMTLPSDIHYADNAMLRAERNVLMPVSVHDWNIPAETASIPVVGYTPEKAKAIFLDRFSQLTTGYGRPSRNVSWVEDITIEGCAA